MTYEPIHHKYRPQTFADLVGQEAIATVLTTAIRTRRIAPAYLFAGPRGTGKTSSARILAKSLNCLAGDAPTEKPCGVCPVCRAIASGSALDIIEIDAASNTGVDNIREVIERAQFAPVQCRYKVYTIDEAHMLSTAAFNALLKTLEEPPAQVVFILATTEPQKVLPTIISRCQRFDFRRIAIDAMVKHLKKIAANENINITDEAVTLVAQVAQGGLRDAESLLDQLSLLAGEVTVEKVWNLVGSVPEQDLMELLQAIGSDLPSAVIDRARNLMELGREPLIVLQNLAGFYRDLLIAKTAPSRSDLVERTRTTFTKLCEEAKNWDTDTILQSQNHLQDSEVQIKNTTQPSLWLEITLLGLLPRARKHPIAGEEENQIAKGVVVDATASPLRERDRQKGKNETSPPVLPTAPHTPSPPPSIKLVTDVSDSPTDPPNPKLTPLPPPNEQSLSKTDREVDRVQPDLKQIWQAVIEHLQPESTQTLLRQNCQLLSFDGQYARIGISSIWLKNAQDKSSKIEAAFQAVYKRKVKAIIQVVEPKSSKTAPADKAIPPAPNAPDLDAKPNSASSRSYPSPSQADFAPQVVEDEVDLLADRIGEFFLGKIFPIAQVNRVPSPTPKLQQSELIYSAGELESEPSDWQDEEDLPF